MATELCLSMFFSSQSSLLANTPSSMRTGPSTPVTPCRLSLGDSFPPRRPLAPTSSLAKLVLERGISAQVSAETPPSSPRPTARQPLFRFLPSTPPNSPSHSPAPSPVPTDSRQHPADNFLASRPAELFLQDVYGLNLGRAPHPDLPSPSQDTPARVPSGGARPDPVNVSLVERLRRLGFTKVLHGSEAEASVSRQDSATFVSAGGGSLLDGLRRNQSLPAMIGARAGKSASNLTPPLHPTSLALPRHLGETLKSGAGISPQSPMSRQLQPSVEKEDGTRRAHTAEHEPPPLHLHPLLPPLISPPFCLWRDESGDLWAKQSLLFMT